MIKIHYYYAQDDDHLCIVFVLVLLLDIQVDQKMIQMSEAKYKIALDISGD